MKKVFSLFAVFCLTLCLAMPVFAEPSGVGREDVLSGKYDDENGDLDGDSIAGDASNSVDVLQDEIANQKDTLGGVFGEMDDVSQFMAYTVGSIFDVMPESFIVYLLLTALVIVLLAVLRSLVYG